MVLRHYSVATTLAVTLALATPAYAVTEIQWWHAMTGPNNDVVVKLANDFNASQGDYKIVPTFKGSYADTLNAGIAAFRAGNAPGIMQVFEVGTATMMAARGAVKPVSALMKEQGEALTQNPICRRSPATTRPRRATCCRFRSIRRAWCCGSISMR